MKQKLTPIAFDKNSAVSGSRILKVKFVLKLLKKLFKPNISLNTVSMLMIRLMPWASIITKPKRIASFVYRFNAAFVIFVYLNGFIIL